MGEPVFPEVEDIEADLKSHEQIWGLFEEFNTSMQQFADEEWIVFRSKTFRFEEFLNQWSKCKAFKLSLWLEHVYCMTSVIGVSE